MHFQRLDVLLLLRRNNIERSKSFSSECETRPGLLLHVLRDLGGVVREIADVAVRSTNDVVRAQKLRDRLSLCRRLTMTRVFSGTGSLRNHLFFAIIWGKNGGPASAKRGQVLAARKSCQAVLLRIRLRSALEAKFSINNSALLFFWLRLQSSASRAPIAGATNRSSLPAAVFLEPAGLIAGQFDADLDDSPSVLRPRIAPKRCESAPPIRGCSTEFVKEKVVHNHIFLIELFTTLDTGTSTPRVSRL